MARYFDVHPDNPQPRSIAQVVDILREGGVIAYPTDSGFALGCLLGNHAGTQRIRVIRGLDERHHLTVVVNHFAQLGTYVEMDNWVFRAIKAATPGPYTFILHATREVPRVMQHPKKKTIGVRVPQHTTVRVLLDAVGEPLVSSSLILPGHSEAMDQGWLIDQELGYQLDAVIDSGDVSAYPTTVIDLSDGQPVIVRRGAGDTSLFE